MLQLDESEILKWSPGRLTSGCDSGTSCTGDSLGPTGGHDILEREKHPCPYRYKISAPSSP